MKKKNQKPGLTEAKAKSDLSSKLCGKFNWIDETDPKYGELVKKASEPFENAVALAELPVKIVYKHVEDLITDTEEDGYETKYTGYIMEVLPNQKFLASNYKHLKIIGQANLST